MSNGNQSFSVANGAATGSDWRVNYEFGLVLGVNEFRQEQNYFLSKDYLFSRELHGYGTVSGLQVKADRSGANDVQVTVKPGLALDQFGRSVVVRSDQCARLGAWLAKHQSEIADHQSDPSGYMHVYVVASYNECMDAPVPVAAQLCNTGNGTSVPSRIRDYFDIEFRWDPPAMPAWDGVRAFAGILAQVRIQPRVKSNEQDIIKQVRQIGQSNIVAQVWYLPSETAREALDRIFSVWVTEVRPTLAPNLIDANANDGASESGILLARIDFTPGDTSQNNNGSIPITDFINPPSNDGRPFLLHTQLIDELLLAGQHEAGARPEGAVMSEREFATLSVRNNRVVQAWVHHPEKLVLFTERGDWSDQLELKCDGQPLNIANVTQLEMPDLKNLVEIEVSTGEADAGPLMNPGSRVELIFHVDGIAVQGDEDEYEEEDDENPVEQVVEEVEEGAERVEAGIEEVAGEGEKLLGKGIAEVGKGVAKVGKAVERHFEKVGDEIKEAGKDVEQAGKKVEEAGRETVAEAEVEEEEADRDSLGDSIEHLGIDYVGYDRDENTITVYTIANHRPARDPVTFFTFDARADTAEANIPHAELRAAVGEETFLALWFHTEDPVKLPEQVQVQRVFTHQAPQSMMFRTAPPQGSTFSFFWALQPLTGQGDPPLTPGELLYIAFDTDQISIGGDDASEKLTEAMKEQQYTFVGYDNDHTIEVYHQVSFPRREEERRGPPPHTLPFVTVTQIAARTLGSDAEDTQDRNMIAETTFELWFHLTADPVDDLASFNEGITCEVRLELSDLRRHGRIEGLNITPVQPNVFNITMPLPRAEPNKLAHYLCFKFPLEGNPVSIRNGRHFSTLGEYMRETGLQFEGFNGRDAVLAYARIAAGRITREPSR